jgi:6-pyruvoyltetrahydropterin/6-carboxytetrahydropterin synthase
MSSQADPFRTAPEQQEQPVNLDGQAPAGDSPSHVGRYRVERLHGHNHRTAVEVEGDLDENRYVFDFIALKHRTKAITHELDHRMMLATRNPHIRVEEGGPDIRVGYREREWLFPREDCVLLPIENTTAELLAHYIGQRLLEKPRRQHHYRPRVLRVEVEENIGQSATYEWRPA